MPERPGTHGMCQIGPGMLDIRSKKWEMVVLSSDHTQVKVWPGDKLHDIILKSAVIV